jgi:hypothetical protein
LNRVRVVILGASGYALDVLDIIDALGAPREAAGVLDDRYGNGSESCRVIGMGAVVLRDVPAGVVIVGNPARPPAR